MAENYHHGDLRRTLLDAATLIVDRDGAAALTLRSCAREAGVSHAAPAHHVGDLCGLRTALAARFWDALGAALESSMQQSGEDPTRRLCHLCEAYIAYATAYPKRYHIMFRCDQLNNNDPELLTGYHRASAPLVACVSAMRKGPTQGADLLLIWSTVHGLSELIAAGAAGPAAGGPGASTPPAAVLERLVTSLFGRSPTDLTTNPGD